MNQEDEKLLTDIDAESERIEATARAIEAKILERVPQVLEDITKHPYRVGLTHAKILAAALKIEEQRVEKAAIERANAMREQAVMAFDEICVSMWGKDLQNANLDEARNAFLEKLGVKPAPEVDHPADGERHRHQ